MQSLDNVVKLVIAAVSTKGTSVPQESTQLSFSELQDLQSKLMLVAGKATKGKDHIDRFVEVSYNTINTGYIAEDIDLP